MNIRRRIEKEVIMMHTMDEHVGRLIYQSRQLVTTRVRTIHFHEAFKYCYAINDSKDC